MFTIKRRFDHKIRGSVDAAVPWIAIMRSFGVSTVVFGCAVVLFLLLGGPTTAWGQTLRTCGNEGERACRFFEKDIWNGRCDTGLQFRRERCGCLVRGLFGNCLIPQFCRVCRNDTRHRSTTASQFASSWVAWALRNQRDQLAVDEPINWVMRFGTHNAFNTFSDGHAPRLVSGGLADLADIVDAPNQFYSMTDQLNLGSRALALDAHWAVDNARLCHSFVSEKFAALEAAICLVPDVLGGDGLFPSMRYFANGIKELRNWLARHPDEIVIVDLENYVGCQNGCDYGTPAYIADPLRTYLGGRLLSNTLAPDGEQPFPSRAELLATGARVVYVTNGPVGENFEFTESNVISGAFPVWTRNNQDFDGCRDILTGENHGGPVLAKPGQFSVLVEDRTLQAGFVELIDEAFGQLSIDDIRKAAECNYTVISTDFLGSDLSGLELGRRLDRPDFSRHEAAVWSWRVGDRGNNGDCAMVEASSGRWVSADCGQSRHYVCAPPRSESGTEDRSKWRQLEDRWKITETSGPWEGGPAACAAEFPFDPVEDTAYVFSVPVNGYQNARLMEANASNRDLWLNYTDQAKEGSWVIARLADVNAPPVADAGPDQELECGNDVVLDGSASHDADGDPLTYTWTGPFGTLTGPLVTARLGPGVNVISLTVQDGRGGVGTDSVSITILDSTPPSLFVALSPSVLWPPNGAMTKIVADVQAVDTCDGRDVLIELRSIVSSEPENDKGNRNTAPDIQDAEFGTGDLEFSLRARRSGYVSGRVYTAIYRAIDLAGNSAEVSTQVIVPHDRGKRGSGR